MQILHLQARNGMEKGLYLGCWEGPSELTQQESILESGGEVETVLGTGLEMTIKAVDLSLTVELDQATPAHSRQPLLVR